VRKKLLQKNKNTENKSSIRMTFIQVRRSYTKNHEEGVRV